MPSPPTPTRSLPLLPVASGATVALVLAIAIVYLNRSAPSPQAGAASPEAKAYLRNLELKDVTMKASENFMNQQVVEVEGAIANNGLRPLRSIEVFCLFYGVNGNELHRERVPVISSNASPLQPGEGRHFRLPFDTLPAGWNQAIPKMVIAQIKFAG